MEGYVLVCSEPYDVDRTCKGTEYIVHVNEIQGGLTHEEYYEMLPSVIAIMALAFLFRMILKSLINR
ncbi:hypothetical protein tloyanaT_21010 [Thalassotalea loyana]|uniref:Uncharacterized protein n=1 Tax=Thalassotalea loyana TaxID=280483 RepID=A0ABQ6HEJ2_9GAMM|nr:hypothetical protein [Thalassotalea loyana]GLX85849.1 hypothetical protein tloyanaT_21010 [Thalassotalea loyana]